MELGGLLDEFDRYAKNSYIASIKLSIEEMRLFLNDFLTRRTFFINGIMYYGATSKLDDEPRFVFSQPEFTTQDYIDAILPELISRYTAAYGTPTDKPFDKEWSPKPFKAVSDVEKQQAAIIKDRIQEYNQRTLPFRLSKTMHHAIYTVSYSFSTGKIVVSKATKGEVVIDKPEDIEVFLDSKEYYTVHGGKHMGLRDLWFEVLNDDASNPKFGWIDIDNPAELPEKEHKRVVKNISEQLTKAERKHIIMFSGRNYQIWFLPKVGERFNYGSDISSIAEGYGAKAGAIVGKTTDYRNKAVAAGKIWVDTSVYKKNQKLRFFFGMHFKPKTPEKSTGLVSIPLKKSELSSFDPLVDAHPENVLLRFDELKARVDMFCQEANLGEGFPYGDMGYPCYRSARGHNDTSHELTKMLESWKKSPKMHELSKRTVGEEVLQHESITVLPKLDGWLGCMAFNNMGRFKVNGQSLDKQQKREGIIETISSERQRAVFCTKGGMFAWDNYLTHAFEDACRKIGITEAIVTGEIVTYNDIGQVAGREAVTSILNRQEGEEIDKVSTHDRHSFRKLKFVIHDVLSFDGTPVDKELPISQRLALFANVKNDRISVMPFEVIETDLTTNFDAYWKKNVEGANNEGLVVYGGGRRYKVKRKYTLDAAIVGIDTTAKYWQDQKEILSTVVIAVSKKTAKGPTFIGFQRVGNFRMSDEERADLFHKVLGERRNENWDRNSFENIVPYTIPGREKYFWVDPMVVVEVEYESLGNKMGLAFQLHRQQTKGGGRGGGRGYRFGPVQGQEVVASRKLKGPPVIIAERPDKSTFNPNDIRADQADAAGGLQISKKPSNIASEELENPPRVKVTHVRSNPMYGYARGPRWIAGGGMTESSPTVHFRLGKAKKAGHIAFGDTKKTMEDEFVSPIEKGAPRRGQSGWSPNYKPIWDQARQHQSGIDFYPEMTGMAFSSADAIYDERGPMISGMGKAPAYIESQSGKYSLKNLLSDEYHYEEEQSVEDAKQLGRALRKELAHTPDSKDSRDTLQQLVDKEISEEDKQKLIDNKMGSKKFSDSKGFREIQRQPVRSNPASTNLEWNKRTARYRKAYNEWLKEPEPKPDWKTFALKTYEAWELPLLEKGRQFMDAEQNFVYTQAEEAIIHGRFPVPEGEEEEHIFAVITIGDEEYEVED